VTDEPDLLGDGAGFTSEEEWIGALQGEVIGLREEHYRLLGENDSLQHVISELEVNGLKLEDERDRLTEVIRGTVIALETILMDDQVDLGVPTRTILGRVSTGLQKTIGEEVT
jgi:hypothetical protein